MTEQKGKGLKWIIVAVILCLAIPIDAQAAKKIKNIQFKNYEDTVTIKKGESLKLKVSFTPSKAKNKKLKWKSSKKSVVKVDSKGVITGKKKGKATITATTTDGSNKKIKLKVIVGEKVKTLSIIQGQDVEEPNVGTTYQFKVAVSPSTASNKKLKWKSSNENVATVDRSGKVTMKKAGQVEISATTTDGTNIKVSKRFEVVLLVKKVDLSIESTNAYVSKVNHSSVFVKKGMCFRFATLINPSNATNMNIVWNSSNPSVAFVGQNGDVKACACGVAVITAQAVDGSGKKDSFTVIVGSIRKSKCKFIAHRGKSESAPANSLAAIRLALESDFDGVEFDIWKTADDEFAITHDKSLKDMCGADINVTDIPLDEAMRYHIEKGSNIEQYQDEYIACLDQVLELAKDYPDKKIVIELKQTMTQDVIEKLLTKISAWDLQQNVKIISFYGKNISYIRNLTDLGGDTIEVEYLSKEPNDDTLEFCRRYNASLGARYTTVTEEQINYLHANKIAVNVWTVPNFICAYQMVNDMNVDSITTDYELFN